MPKRIAVNTLFVIRDGARRKIKPGTEIDLSAEELEHIKSVAPDSIRNPVNESAPQSSNRAPQLGKGNKGDDRTGEI